MWNRGVAIRTGATPVPHDAPAGRSAPADESAELDDLLEVDFVSPEGIDLNGEAEGRSHQADDFRGEGHERSELVGLPAEAQKRGPPSLALQASADSLREQIERRLVSPEGIDLNGEAEGRSHQADDFRGEPDRAKREMVSPEGIEPSTNRLRVCCSAN
jgi:hypothetical protein